MCIRDSNDGYYSVINIVIASIELSRKIKFQARTKVFLNYVKLCYYKIYWELFRVPVDWFVLFLSKIFACDLDETACYGVFTLSLLALLWRRVPPSLCLLPSSIASKEQRSMLFTILFIDIFLCILTELDLSEFESLIVLCTYACVLVCVFVGFCSTFIIGWNFSLLAR